ncbi:MAG: hypothetical protein ACLTXH_13720 [Enterobacter hormaechei]
MNATIVDSSALTEQVVVDVLASLRQRRSTLFRPARAVLTG